jgi:hypothetical protein
MSSDDAGRAWLESRLADAPPDLAARTREVIALAAPAALPERLAEASRIALHRAEAHPLERAAALDLLVADGLVTLALAAQVEDDPDRLAELAVRLRQVPESGS